MKLEDVLKLAEAGFNKAEITALLSGTETGTAPAPAPAPATETAPATAPAPATETAPAPAPATDNSAVLLDAINKLTATIQKNALQTSSLPGVTTAQTAEDILAEIIHPTFKGGDNQ